MKQKVGIIGVGYVGGALRSWFESQRDRYELFLYDTTKKLGSLREVNQANTIFVSVPTPFHVDAVSGKKGYDDSAVAESLASIGDGKTVVIKSTIVPTSTERFQERFAGKTILFNPEFLRAKTANEDFLHPDRQIVGYANETGKQAALNVLRMLPEAPYTRIMRAREAEMVKYFNNNFLATRVVFANQMYDICKAFGIDYAAVKDGVAQDARVGKSHFDVLHDGYRGYGGACLPKDVRALLAFAKEANVDVRFLEALEQVNEGLRGTARES
jgi:UDPglucose 6-dehydrogenase